MPATPSPDDREAAMRDAEDRALAESGLGSGLLARQTAEAAAEVETLKVCPHCATEFHTAARFCPSDGTALRPKGSDSLIGRVLADRYHILTRIGEGGMGRVYLAEHVKMGRQCAIKVMSPALVNDTESAARFAREASNAARIIHPNVAAVFDYGESEGQVYLVMEYVEGEPLSRVIGREAPLSAERAADIACQIADGLGAAHELGIIHRDLKPDNILVSRNKAGREIAKVVDFGIAKAVQDAAGEALTRSGLVIGTPEFMSPEQLLGDPIDSRSDLFALGCIMHLMLTGEPSFAAPTREQMIKRRLSEDAPRLQVHDPGIPDSLDGIVARLLARAPSDRFATAAELRAALGGTHERRADAPRRPAATHHTPRSMPTVGFETSVHGTTQRTAVARRPFKHKRLVVLGVAGVGALAAALALRGPRDGALEERLRSQQRDSLLRSAIAARAAAATAPAPAAATPAATPVPMVDSARMRADNAARRRSDSLGRAAQLQSAAARTAVGRYARAIESGDVARLKAAYPGMTAKQQEFWERNVFGIAEGISAPVQFGRVAVTGDSAAATFSIRLRYVNKSTRAESDLVLRQQAVLVRDAAGWQLARVY